MTGADGEGMVVNSRAYLARGRRGRLQPAIKSGGREYLRVRHRSDCDRPENLERLKKRRLDTKHQMAIREAALGLMARNPPVGAALPCGGGLLT